LQSSPITLAKLKLFRPAPLRAARNRRAPAIAILAAALLLLAGLAALGIGCASAQTPEDDQPPPPGASDELSLPPAGKATAPEDLPPPPGALQRELSLPPVSKAAPTGSPTILSNPIEIPFALEGGHIIVEASLDGSAPLPFMFDTGAINIITPETAHTINAPFVRNARMAGVGPQVSQAQIVKVDRITMGPAMLDHPLVAITALRNLIVDRGSRPRLAGLIGANLLARYAVTVDYQRHTLTLNSPGFRPQAGFALPLGYAISADGLTHPSIKAELDGATGEFVLDTGSSGQVFLSDAFAHAHPSFATSGKVLSFLSPGGIGGPLPVQLALAKHLQLGAATLSPLAFNRPASGASFSLHADGLLGAVILSQFIVTIDYQSGHAYFEPVAGRTLPPVLHATGMIVDKPDHEAFEVLDVMRGSGAEHAGLRRGQRVIEVAGRPARDLSAADVASLSAFPAHTSLSVRTSDQRRLDLAIGQILP
jgi:predicted aspartyl protease